MIIHRRYISYCNVVHIRSCILLIRFRFRIRVVIIWYTTIIRLYKKFKWKKKKKSVILYYRRIIKFIIAPTDASITRFVPPRVAVGDFTRKCVQKRHPVYYCRAARIFPGPLTSPRRRRCRPTEEKANPPSPVGVLSIFVVIQPCAGCKHNDIIGQNDQNDGQILYIIVT